VAAVAPTHDPDPLRQRAARAYGRSRRRLWLSGSAAGLAGLAAVVAATRALGGVWGVGLLAALPLLVNTPFALAGHRLARRFGLSRQTTAGWLADQAKAWAVGAVIGVVAGAGLLGLQRWLPAGWPAAAWLAALALETVLAVVFPVLLLPLFVRSERLDPGPLRAALLDTCAAAGVVAGDLRLLRMGEKTAAANAMVAGLGPTRRIYVGDTLTERHDETEDDVLVRARVVLAHELGHHVHHDQLRLLGLEAARTAVAVAGLAAGVALLAPDGAGHLSSLPGALLGFAVGSALTSPVSAWYSRRRERSADRFALDLTGTGEPVARTFERLAWQNLAELEPPPLLHALTGSHPTLRERIETARLGPA